MLLSKKVKVILLAFFVITGLFFGAVKINNKIEWRMTQDLIASGVDVNSQFGFAKLAMFKCFTPPATPACAGTPGCVLMDPARCNLTWDVSGIRALSDKRGNMIPVEDLVVSASQGEDTGISQAAIEQASLMPPFVLLSQTQVSMAGIIPGADVLGACMGGPSMCGDGMGVVASWGGCSGCYSASQGKLKVLQEKARYFITMVKERFVLPKN